MAEISMLFSLWVSSVSSFLSSNSLGWLPVRSTTPRSKSAKTPSSQVDLHCWHTTLAANVWKIMLASERLRNAAHCAALTFQKHVLLQVWTVTALALKIKNMYDVYTVYYSHVRPRKVKSYQLKCARSHLSNKEHFSLDRNDQGWGPGRNRLANAFPPLRVGDA